MLIKLRTMDNAHDVTTINITLYIPQVAWRKVDTDKFLTIGEIPWSPEDDLEVHHVQHNEDLDDWTLILPKVKKTDAGLYECQLTASAGFHTLVQLNVVGESVGVGCSVAHTH